MAETALTERLPRSHRARTSVDVQTLARFVGELDLPSVDYLAIDLEGLDLEVLQAVPWSRIRPSVVECEFRGGAAVPGVSWREIGAYLQEQGYTVYVSEWHPLLPDAERQDWRRVLPFSDGLDVHPAAWGKLIAFWDDPGWALVRRAFHRHIVRPARLAAPRPPLAAGAAGAAGANGARSARGRAVGIDGGTEAGAATALPAQLRPAPRLGWLKRRSPSLYRLLRMSLRAARGLWQRRRWTVPLIVALTAWTLLGFVPAMAPFSLHVWGSAALTIVTLVMLYATWRVHRTTRALGRALDRVRTTQLASQKKVGEAQAKIGRLERALADGAGTNAELLRKIGRLEESVAERKTVPLKGRRRG